MLFSDMQNITYNFGGSLDFPKGLKCQIKIPHCIVTNMLKRKGHNQLLENKDT